MIVGEDFDVVLLVFTDSLPLFVCELGVGGDVEDLVLVSGEEGVLQLEATGCSLQGEGLVFSCGDLPGREEAELLCLLEGDH